MEAYYKMGLRSKGLNNYSMNNMDVVNFAVEASSDMKKGQGKKF